LVTGWGRNHSREGIAHMLPWWGFKAIILFKKNLRNYGKNKKKHTGFGALLQQSKKYICKGVCKQTVLRCYILHTPIKKTKLVDYRHKYQENYRNTIGISMINKEHLSRL
jgi:hypothetical protein